MIKVKKTAIFLLLIILVSIAYATNWCGIEYPVNEPCIEITPVLGTCSSYTVSIYNSSFELADTRTMAQIGTTGMYNFTFTGISLGIHKWVACDNTTGTINVRNNDLHNKTNLLLSGMQSNTTSINSNTSADSAVIISTGNTGWITSTLTDASIANTVDSRINTSHGIGSYNSSSASVDTTAIANAVDLRLNASHGVGYWNSSATASVNTTAIATEVWNFNLSSYNSTSMSDSKYWSAGWHLFWTYAFIWT